MCDTAVQDGVSSVQYVASVDEWYYDHQVIITAGPVWLTCLLI